MRHRQRTGFTLIELLVVIAIFMVLAGLVVAFLAGTRDSYRTADGAVLVQGTLNIGKQRALRDQRPRGVRLLIETDPTRPGFGYVVEMQYIEQPDDFVVAPGGPGGLTIPDPNAVKPPPATPQPISAVQLQGIDLWNGNPGDPSMWTAQPGDYIELYGSGLLNRIRTDIPPTQAITVTYDPTTSAPMYTTVQLVRPFARGQGVPTWSYRILRKPRPTGEDSIRLPREVVVDTNINMVPSNDPAFGPFSNPLPIMMDPVSGMMFVDVLFAPSGAVITPGVQTPFLALWVRDTAADAPGVPPPQQFFNLVAANQWPSSTIIGVNVQTGLIAAQDPDMTPGGDPYAFLKSGRSSGN